MGQLLSRPGPPPTSSAYSRQTLALSFAVSGSSSRQREASLVGLLPFELHQLIMSNLPVTPEYDRLMTGSVGTVGNGMGDGPGQFELGHNMCQVSFGPDGTVWTVDRLAGNVHHFKKNGELLKTIGTVTAGGGSGPGETGHRFNGPFGIAVSRLRDSVFVNEYSNGRISEFNQSDGAFVRVLNGTETLENDMPCGMCLSPDEATLAVACAGNDNIRILYVDGSEAPRTIGGQRGSGDGQLNHPCDVHFTPDGHHLVVADRGNNRVQVLRLEDGSFVHQMPLDNRPRAVAVDAVGNIIASSEKYSHNHIKVFSPEGTLLHDCLAGLEIGCPASGGLAIDPCSGMIAVGDASAGQVHLLAQYP